MLLQAIKKLNIDPARSFMVGDKKDLLAESAGIKNILVRSSKEITDDGLSLADYVLDTIVIYLN